MSNVITTITVDTNKMSDVVDMIIDSLNLPSIANGSDKQISWAESIVHDSIMECIDLPSSILDGGTWQIIGEEFKKMLPEIIKVIEKGAKSIIDNRGQFSSLSSHKLITATKVDCELVQELFGVPYNPVLSDAAGRPCYGIQPTMIIDLIERRDYTTAIDAIKTFPVNDEYLSVITDLHSARLCTAESDIQHFCDCAILRIRDINGSKIAADQLSSKIAASAIIADNELDNL